MTTALCFLAALLAAGALYLLVRLIRLRRSLAREQAENRRLRALLVIDSQEAGAELEAIRRLRHDLRHYLSVLQAQPGVRPLPDQLACALDRPLSAPSGIRAVSALAAHYQRQAQAAGARADIRLELEPCRDELLPDLCLLLSNLLENAVEALQREGGGQLRVRGKSTPGYLSLVAVNTCTRPLRAVNGRYLSGKAEGRFGIGLATVQEIARKYGGQAEFTADGREFRATVFLPLSAPAEVPGAVDDGAAHQPPPN